MNSNTRFCLYVDWLAVRRDDSVPARIDADVIPDDEESETCIYWDEKRENVLVLTWNIEASDQICAREYASSAALRAVGQLSPGRLGEITVYPLDDE